MLKINKLNKIFGKKKVVDALTLDIPESSVTVFLGESGVGKSTLLRILAGLEAADTGEISIKGKKFDRVSQHKEHMVGMVFQQFNLFAHKTVKQNITLPLEIVRHMSAEQADDVAKKLLARFNLAELADTSVDSLSGGQKQRLALARTLAMKPYIICMDEPTSALDPVLTAYVAQVIADLAKQGYIVVVATHDTVLIDKIHCTVHLMKDGKVIESADSIEYKEHPEKYPFIKNFVAGDAH